MSYIKIDKTEQIKTNFDKFKKFVKMTFKFDLFKGLALTIKEMFRRDNSHTLLYPLEKMELNNRYRGVHKLLRILESGNERCIGCGLCAKICISNCINMETFLDKNGRKEVSDYSINFGRCVYCGMCADVCPELAIVHGKDYEFASEQRAYYGLKEDLILKVSDKNDVEFEGYGSISKNLNHMIKRTATAYVDDEEDEL